MCCPFAPDDGLLVQKSCCHGSRSPQAHPSWGTHSVKCLFLSFFNESIAASSPQGSLPPAPVVAAVEAWGQGCSSGQWQTRLWVSSLAWLAAGSWGNPSGLLNKGQSWILAMASFSLIPDSGPAALWYEATWGGRLTGWTWAQPGQPHWHAQVQRLLGCQAKYWESKRNRSYQPQKVPEV